MNTRFAPSLTGFLHLGHVLHMIYVWGVAKKKHAQVLCRIEDHDLSRARPEYEVAILNNMKWLGFVPRSGLTTMTAGGRSDFRQSDCVSHYAEVLEHLVARGLVYGCSCSRKEIAETQSADSGELCYSGTCSAKGLPLEGHTVRFRMPAEEVRFQDLNFGEQLQLPQKQCGDFSLRDRQGQWTYQFACVCDDIRHGVDLVIRGEDILFSTARQILLLQALGAEAPDYFHHGLICDESGRKLSKRQRSESVSRMKESGISANEIIGRAAYSGGLITEFRSLTAKEAILLVQ